MRYIFNPITEQLEAPDNPSPLYENLGKKFKLAGIGSVLPEDFDDLTPKEEQYYQQDKFSTHPDFLAAEGGRVGFKNGSDSFVEMKYITEQKNVKGELLGYRVKVSKQSKKSRTGSSEIFYIKDYPSKDAALEAAKAKRNLDIKTLKVKAQDPAMKGLDTRAYEKIYRAKPEQIERISKYIAKPEFIAKQKLSTQLRKAKDPEAFRKKKRDQARKVRDIKGLSGKDLIVLDKMSLKLKYQKAYNDIIIANKGLTLPTTEMTPRIEALLKNDPIFMELYNKIYPDQPFKLS